MAQALFLRERLCERPQLFAAMPVNLKGLTGKTSALQNVYYVEDSGIQVHCRPVREFGLSGISARDALRFGQCVDTVEIASEETSIRAGLFLMPSFNMRSTTVEVEIELRNIVSFETAGVQAHLWLSVYSEFKYQGFLGTIDRDFIAESMDRTLMPGDAMVVEVGIDDCFEGVVELNENQNGIWQASLHLPMESTPPLEGRSLLSFHRTELDGIEAEFRQPIGSVVKVRRFIETKRPTYHAVK